MSTYQIPEAAKTLQEDGRLILPTPRDTLQEYHESLKQSGCTVIRMVLDISEDILWVQGNLKKILQ